MDSLRMFSMLNPSYWTTLIMCFGLLPMVVVMLFGWSKGSKKDEMWAYRGAGVEIAFILLPFVFYAIGNALNGSYEKFMASPELPMAAMILFLMTIFSLLKGLAVGAKRDAAVEPFIVLTFVAIAMAMSCAAYISWLAYRQDVSPWFGVANSVVIVLATLFAYALNAAMAYLIKSPEQFSKPDEAEQAES